MPKTPTKIFGKFKLLMILWHVYLIKILFNHCIEFELKETNLKKKNFLKAVWWPNWQCLNDEVKNWVNGKWNLKKEKKKKMNKKEKKI